jgi:hypothetical protein
MMERMKRINKAEIPEFYGFCFRRQRGNSILHSYPTPPYPSSVQTRPNLDNAYDGPSSRPLGSDTSTTYSSDGPQTPFCIQSPMNMNTVIINRAERASSPELLETVSQNPIQLSRSQFRVRRKTLASSKPIPDRIDETDYNETNAHEQISSPSLFDDRAASAISPFTGSRQDVLIAPIGDTKNLRPSPLQLRRPSATVEPHSLSSPKSLKDGDQNKEAKMHHDTTQVDPLACSPMTVSITTSLRQTQPNSLSPVSPELNYLGASEHSSSGPSLTQHPFQRARSRDGLQIRPARVVDAQGRDVYDDDDSRLHGALQLQLDLADTTLKTLSYVRSDTSPAKVPTKEDCTLELVDDLSSIELRMSQVYRDSPDTTIPDIIRQPFPTPYPVEKEVESGLELAPQFVSPIIMRKYSYPHPERPESDGLSLRRSVKSSSSSKSKLRFLKRLGGAKESVHTDSTPSLPLNLQSCFSVCSSSLMLWSKKDSDIIVQIRSPFTSGQRYNLAMPMEPYSDPTNAQKGFSIRLVAGSTKMVVAYACSNKVC